MLDLVIGVIVIICLIITFFRLKIKDMIYSAKGGKDYLFTRKKADFSNINSDEIIFNIKGSEKYFQEFQFLTWSRYVVMNYLNCNKDNSDKELQKVVLENALKKRTKILKSKNELYVKDANYYSYDQENDEISVLFHMKEKEYVLTENEISNSKDYYFIVSFAKSTNLEKSEKMYKCSLCGAPTKFTFFGRCGYCGKYIYVSDVMWQMKDIIEYSED